MTKMAEIVNRHTARIERLMPGPIDRVWDHFTSSEGLTKWLMAATVEREQNGLIQFLSEPIPEGVIERAEPAGEKLVSNVFAIRGVISEFQSPNLFVFTWNEHGYGQATTVRVELEERGDQVLVILTHSHLDPTFMAAVAAGWHAHLEVLAAILRGEDKPDFWPIFNKLLEEYKVVVAAAGIVVVATTAAPAAASELSNEAYKAIRQQKHELLVKYDAIWQDADEIRNDISRLENSSNPDNKALDALHRDLKEKKADLRDIELDIRDLEAVLK